LHWLWSYTFSPGHRAWGRRMKRSEEKELMDLPVQSRALLEEDLGNLRTINRWLGGSRAVIRGLQYALRRERLSTFSILDLGTGSADIPQAIIAWARAEGFAARIVGLDQNSVMVETALLRTKHLPQVSIVCGDAVRPPFSPRSFDFIIASQLLHHFSEANIVRCLRAWSELARRAIIISDLVRHGAAYYGIRWLTRLTTRNVMTLTDAPLSVRRAFTLPEWRDLLRYADVGRLELFPVFPFRMTALLSVQD
jgi:2-polyprenyl-3-methyl-5-hydroxy-6-metoxy-1,4-benzoquinol methylase